MDYSTTENEQVDGATVQITLLGSFAVRIAGRLVDPEAWRLVKARNLLKILALAPQQALPRDQALDLLWPDFSPEAALNNLYTTLAAVRRALAPDGTVRLRDGVLALETALPLAVDVDRFEAAARHALGTRDLAAYEAALSLYTGELLPEDRYEEWTLARRDSLRATQQQLRFALAKLRQEQGADEMAAALLQQIVDDDPLLEEAHLALMRLHAANGRQVAAIRQYQALRAALEAQLDTEPSAEVRRLYAALVTNREPPRRDAPARNTETELARPRHNLPSALSSFVGRQQEVAAIAEVIAGRDRPTPPRLVTLIGIGGMGKTRLALAVAETSVAHFPGGVWFVDLAPLRDGALVAGAVASALGVRERAGQSLLTTVCEAIAERALLIILDNCEHLLPTVRELVEAVLRRCPRCQFLATSRERIQLAGEVHWAVPPLATPPLELDEQASPEALERVAAVNLFLGRVRERRPQYVLMPEDIPAVATICRRLDGLPLALELAAARTTVLTMHQLADRLDNLLGLLASRERVVPERQQTIRTILDWSHALLAADEQRLLAQLSVFDGGATLAAIEAVADAEPLALLDQLTTLGDQSLIEPQTRAAGEPRFRLLELVREYAHERLVASGEAAAVRSRHAAHYLALAEARDHDQAIWQRQLLDEEDNLRAALRWAEERGDAALGLRLVGALFSHWRLRGYYREGRHWATTFLALPAPPQEAELRFAALLTDGHLAYLQGDQAVARTQAEAGLALARAAGDRARESAFLVQLGHIFVENRHYAVAEEYYEAAIAIERQLPGQPSLAVALGGLGSMLVRAGQPLRARAAEEEALALFRRRGDGSYVNTALRVIGLAAQQMGDVAAARAHFTQSLLGSVELGDRRVGALGLLDAATLMVEAAPAQALRLAAFVDAAARRDITLLPTWRAQLDGLLAAARAQLSPAVAAAAFAAGADLSLASAVAEALAILDETARDG